MQVFTATLTFGASGTVSLTDLAGNGFKCTRIRVAPANGNTHVSYIGNTSFTGTPPTGLIHQFQIPDSSNKILLDVLDLSTHTAQNDIQFNQFTFAGTNTEKLIATVFVA